jgi:hypothetical protein
VQTLKRTETITDADFLDKQTYHLADGSTLPSRRFVIRSLKIGDKTLEDVVGAIVPVAGGLLLGQSFLSRFKSWSTIMPVLSSSIEGASVSRSEFQTRRNPTLDPPNTSSVATVRPNSRDAIPG